MCSRYALTLWGGRFTHAVWLRCPVGQPACLQSWTEDKEDAWFMVSQASPPDQATCQSKRFTPATKYNRPITRRKSVVISLNSFWLFSQVKRITHIGIHVWQKQKSRQIRHTCVYVWKWRFKRTKWNNAEIELMRNMKWELWTQLTQDVHELQ